MTIWTWIWIHQPITPVTFKFQFTSCVTSRTSTFSPGFSLLRHTSWQPPFQHVLSTSDETSVKSEGPVQVPIFFKNITFRSCSYALRQLFLAWHFLFCLALAQSPHFFPPDMSRFQLIPLWELLCWHKKNIYYFMPVKLLSMTCFADPTNEMGSTDAPCDRLLETKCLKI